MASSVRQGRAVVEIGAAVPGAVPPVVFDMPAEPGRLVPAVFGKGLVAVNPRNLRKLGQHGIKEKSQPNAFAFTVFPHKVHAVVPITRADEWQAVFAKADASQDGPHTVIIQTGRLFRPSGKIVIRVLIRVYRAALDKVDSFI